MSIIQEPVEETQVETPSAAYEQVAGEMLRHARTWIEDHGTAYLLNCECGFSVSIEDEEEADGELSVHRSDELSRVVNQMLAAAWDNGWLEGSEGQFPTMAGILLNPYRQIKADFDLNRTVTRTENT